MAKAKSTPSFGGEERRRLEKAGWKCTYVSYLQYMVPRPKLPASLDDEGFTSEAGGPITNELRVTVAKDHHLIEVIALPNQVNAAWKRAYLQAKLVDPTGLGIAGR